MTHTSDVAYMHRATGNTWVFLFMLQHVYRYDRFGALHYKRLMRFELRSLVTIMLMIGIPLQMISDYGILEIKYQVGFIAAPGTVVGVPSAGTIFGTPFQYWQENQKERALVLNYFLAMALACFSSMLFLLQSFWAYITRTIARTNFMSSFEYKLTLTWSAMVMALFPLMQWLYRDAPVARELAPQMAFSINDFILAAMGVRSHFRFNAIIRATRETNNENARTVIAKLEYYQFMNKVMSMCLFGSGFTLGAICVDGLLTVPYINTHKWASDFLITQTNLFEPLLMLLVVMVLYPRKTSSHANFGDTSRGSKGSTVAAKPAHVSQHHNGSGGENKYRQDGYHQTSRPVNSSSHHQGGGIPLETYSNNNTRSYNSNNIQSSSHDQPYQTNNSQRRPSEPYNSRSMTDSSMTATSQSRSKDIKMPTNYENYDPNHDTYLHTFKDTDRLTDVKNNSSNHNSPSLGAMQGNLAHQLSQNHLNNNNNNGNSGSTINGTRQQSIDYYPGLQNSDSINIYQASSPPSLSIPRAQSPLGVPLSPRQQQTAVVGNGSSGQAYMLDDVLLAQPGTLSLSPSQTQRQQQLQQQQQQQQQRDFQQTPILTAKSAHRNTPNLHNHSNLQYSSQPSR